MQKNEIHHLINRITTADPELIEHLNLLYKLTGVFICDYIDENFPETMQYYNDLCLKKGLNGVKTFFMDQIRRKLGLVSYYVHNPLELNDMNWEIILTYPGTINEPKKILWIYDERTF